MASFTLRCLPLLARGDPDLALIRCSALLVDSDLALCLRAGIALFMEEKRKSKEVAPVSSLHTSLINTHIGDQVLANDAREIMLRMSVFEVYIEFHRRARRERIATGVSA